MSYTAKHFVKIAGRMYTPGEIIDNPIPDDKLQRLLRLNAVEAIETVGAEPAAWQGIPAHEEMDAHDESPTDTAPDEDDDGEEMEMPEIDVMDGVVTAEAQKAPAHAAKTVRPKKSSGGRKKA